MVRLAARSGREFISNSLHIRANWVAKLLVVGAMLTATDIRAQMGPWLSDQPTQNFFAALQKTGEFRYESRAPVDDRPVGNAMATTVRAGARVRVHYREAKLGDILEQLPLILGRPVHVSRKSLEDAGIRLDQVITMDVESLEVETFLDFFCQETDLAYSIQDGIVVLTSVDDFERHCEARVYPVRDLLDYQILCRNRSWSGKLPTGYRHPPVGQGTTNANPGTAIGSSTADTSWVYAFQPPDDREYARVELISALTSTIAPDSWEVNGGYCTAMYVGDLLIVSAPHTVHRHVSSFLVKLREGMRSH